LRKFILFAFLCAFPFAHFARAQEVDFAVGDSILWSPKNTTALTGYVPPPEKGGAYPTALLQYRSTEHFGINIEGAIRYHKGTYNFYQPYRPILYDANAVYTTRFPRNIEGDFMAGIGAQTVLFYTQTNACYIPAGGCRTYLNSTHFLVHAGAGLRYYWWRNFFVRPEANWYYIHNNYQFHSDNVFRLGASVGYTFGARRSPDKKKAATNPPAQQ
jgi:hypothetical protein